VNKSKSSKEQRKKTLRKKMNWIISLKRKCKLLTVLNKSWTNLNRKIKNCHRNWAKCRRRIQKKKCRQRFLWTTLIKREAAREIWHLKVVKHLDLELVGVEWSLNHRRFNQECPAARQKLKVWELMENKPELLLVSRVCPTCLKMGPD